MATATTTSSDPRGPNPYTGNSFVHDGSSVTSQGYPLSDANSSALLQDNEKHPKGKRKRTALKDKMILEDAYGSNPKPDKQARLDIVQRVAMNEKEVQIWFQNRRQNDRRKSRPLSPQEIEALRYGGMSVLSSDPITNTNTPSKPKDAFPTPESTAAHSRDRTNSAPRLVDHTPSMNRSHYHTVNSTPGPANYPDMTPKHPEPSPFQESQDGSQSMSSSVGYLANRWNLGNSFSTPPSVNRSGDDSFRLDGLPPSSCTSIGSQPSSQSKVRLSLSLEGKAEVVSNQVSPSRTAPARPSSTTPILPQVRHRSLQRSHSALPSVTLPPLSALTESLSLPHPPKLMRGRSRDVHAWESCADAEVRDELTAQAEHESNGSAIAAISLLRSSSGVLQPSTAKRNAPMTKGQRPPQAKKAKLDRGDTSIARIDTNSDETDKIDKEPGKVKVSMLVSPSGDSDKENWSPDEDGNPPDFQYRRPLPPSSPSLSHPRRIGRVLQEQKSPKMLGNRASTAPSRPRGLVKEGLEIFEDAFKYTGQRRDDDVEKFMRGSVSPSKKPDMDCVAGLLSLSQGAWR